MTTAATASVVVKTRPTASRLIGRTLRHSSRGERKNAAEKRIGGRKRASTRSGSISKPVTPGSRPTMSPATTIGIGYGTPMRAANSVTAATTASRKRICASSATARSVGHARRARSSHRRR